MLLLQVWAAQRWCCPLQPLLEGATGMASQPLAHWQACTTSKREHERKNAR